MQKLTLGNQKWVYQAIQDRIKSHILENSLKPGDMLPTETELAQQFGVGRNSVREAVKSLETLGIVEARRGAGLTVAPFTFDRIFDNLGFGVMFGMKNIIDIIEMRFYLEYGMAELLMHNLTASQLEELEAIIKRMHKGAQKGTWSMDEDRAFHLAMWGNVENALISKILDIFWRTYHHARQYTTIPTAPHAMDNYHRHCNILNALRSHDVKELKSSIVRHYINKKYLEDRDLENIDTSMVRYLIGLTLRMDNSGPNNSNET